MADVEKLISVATDTSVGSFHRRMAVADLARAKDPQAIGVLTSLLDDDDAYLRREVVTGLARIEDSTVIEPLIRALDDRDDYLQRDAANALSRIGDGRAIGPLRVLLEDNSYSVRDAAKRALEKIERRSPAPPPAAPLAPPSEPPAALPETAAPEQATQQATEPAPVAEAQRQSVAETQPAVGEEALVRSQEEHAEVPIRFDVDTSDWNAARRFQTLFGDAVADLPALYTQLAEAESGILEAEQQYRATLQQLGDVESAGHDQLSRLEREIDTANTAIVELRREGTRAKRNKYKAERESSSVSFQVSALFSSEKSRVHRERVKKLASEIRRTEDQAAETQEQLKTLRQQHDVLANPLREMQQQLESLSEKRNSARQAVGKASGGINAWMSEHLQRLSSETLRSRLDKLAEMSADRDLFKTCTDELIRATTELQAHISERDQNEAQMQQAVAAAEQTTNALGESIALGFHQTSVEQRANVRLSGSVSFREEHGVFSGYSGASGTASGSGTGHASYTIDQLQWAAISDFGQRVAAFTEAWSRCGDRGANGEMLDSLVAACGRRVADLVRLIRAELERDFRGGLTR